ncbi:hepatocyte growth factor receptor-like [Patiria miniata]|uniref:Hepatocyte growth factor receptor n=1 Tax=Patiria miniata TaxID=46514 RepID=A0A913ZQR6_PATMI|nr:hepatocyte growth factor receptor-like [Patiria miniata]
MTDILAAFREAVRGCIQDGNTYSVEYLNSFCSFFRIPILDRYLCKSHTVNGGISLFRYAKGIDPVPSTAILELPGTLMSSITTTLGVNHTIALIGTSAGDLLKVHVESSTTGRLYERVSVDASPVLRDIHVDSETHELILLTEQKLVKLGVDDCSQYTTCAACIGTKAGQDGDPYCGWCSLERKCTRYCECPLPDVSTRWLAYDAEQCLEITSVEASLPITKTEWQMSMTIQQLPDLSPGQSYQCHFGSYASPAIVTEDSLTCTTPPSGRIPPIEKGSDAVSVELSVYSTETSVNFLSLPFHFYECSSHTSCVSCVGSRWACDWCVFEDRCTHESSTCRRGNEIIITGDKNSRVSTAKGATFCPQLQAQGGEVLIPVGVSRSVTLSTENLPDPAQVSSYRCLLHVEGNDILADAERSGETITCKDRAYSFSGGAREVHALLIMEWTDNLNVHHLLDDVYSYTVTLYNCTIVGRACSRCVAARPALSCVWCGNTCSYDTQCSAPRIVTLNNGLNCPDPVLTEVHPASGPIEGNTVITLSGTDLGRRFGDVKSTVGGQVCDIVGLESNYSIGERLSCLVRSHSEGPALIALTVTGADGSLQYSSSSLNFIYADPRISNFSPTIGPEAGGTLVTVSGTALQAGRNIEAYFGDKPCVVISVRDDGIQCLTPPSVAGTIDILRLSFDGANRTSTSRFFFASDPVIRKVSPLTSIEAGGRNLTVTGKDFHIIETPKIVAYCLIENTLLQFKEKCRTNSDTSMACPTPDVRPYRCNEVPFGFVMDGVTQLLTWSESKRVTLEYFQDPVYFQFDEEGFVANGNLLELTGKRINYAITAKEINVYVGNGLCEVTYISGTILQCTLPKVQPTSLDESGDLTAVVQHNNLVFELGKVIYGRPANHIIAIAVPSVIIPFSLAIVLAASLMYCKQMRRKRTYEQRVLNTLLEVHLEISANVSHGRSERSQIPSHRRSAAKHKRIAMNNRVSFVPRDIHIEFSQLEFGETLGQGAFGRVLQATLRDPAKEDQLVAVKTVQDTSDPKLVVRFLDEGFIMTRFDHVNVMGLLGLTFDTDNNPLLVLPFMANGDLKKFMIKKKKSMPTSLLLRFASHVALGMSYLAQHKFVHRDLAARNCMVDGDLLVKIADFGLSRDVQESDYYTSGDAQAKLPIKWMAPESMERRVYNARTDAWSYGVVLWEIFSRGERPYPGVANKDVFDILRSGQRMDAPKDCPPQVYRIMERCWQDNPKSRCTFSQIVNELDDLLARRRAHDTWTGVGGQGPGEHGEASGAQDDSYLVPIQMETSFGVDGPCTDVGTSEDSATATNGARPDYVNKSVFR